MCYFRSHEWQETKSSKVLPIIKCRGMMYGGVEMQLRAFSPPHQMDLDGQPDAPAALPSGKHIPVPTGHDAEQARRAASLDAGEERKLYCPCQESRLDSSVASGKNEISSQMRHRVIREKYGDVSKQPPSSESKNTANIIFFMPVRWD